ncbi:hypothetical protein BJ742DRAFT_825124 [Cladochytrium replicatum]|nr:hypothetical protein BJ742DRAFT_825124 [Cladochytrium replicatum]
MLQIALKAVVRRSFLLVLALVTLVTVSLSLRAYSQSDLQSEPTSVQPILNHNAAQHHQPPPPTQPSPVRAAAAVRVSPAVQQQSPESKHRTDDKLPHFLASGSAAFDTTIHETKFSLVQSDSSSPYGICLMTASPPSASPTLRSCANDEPINAQTLVHPAMLLHPFPRRTLVLGFPEGSVSKELLRHFTLSSISWLPWSSAESVGQTDNTGRPWKEFEKIASRFSAPYIKASGEHTDYDDLLDRLSVPEAASTSSYLSASTTATFDVIFIDNDAVQFLPLAKSKLRAGGIIAIPGGPATFSSNGFKLNIENSDSPVLGVDNAHHAIFSTLVASFKHVHTAAAFRPSKSELWTYHYATDSDALPNPTMLHPQLVDIWIGRRITGDLSQYDGITHANAFSIPAWLRAELKHSTYVGTAKAASNPASNAQAPARSHKDDDDDDGEDNEEYSVRMFGQTVLATPDDIVYEPFTHLVPDDLPAITPLGGSFFSYDFFGCSPSKLLNATLLEEALRQGLTFAHASGIHISRNEYASLANVTLLTPDDLEPEDDGDETGWDRGRLGENAHFNGARLPNGALGRKPAKHPAVFLTASFDGGVLTVAAFPSFRYLAVDAMNVNAWVAIDEAVGYMGDVADSSKTTGAMRRRGANIEGGRLFDDVEDGDDEDENAHSNDRDTFEEDRLDDLLESKSADHARLQRVSPKDASHKELKRLWRLLVDTSTHSSPASTRFVHSAAYTFTGTYWTHPLIAARREGATAGTGQFATGLIKQGEPVFTGYIEESLRAGSLELVRIPTWKSEFLGHMSEMVEVDVYVAPMLYETDVSFYTNHGCDPTVWYGGNHDHAAVNTLHVQHADGYTPETLAHYGPYDIMTARKDMNEGDEVTYDYATVDADGPGSDFVCGCGSPICRHKVTHKDWDTHPELVERYGIEHFMPHISKLIRGKERRGNRAGLEKRGAVEGGFVRAAFRRRAVKAKGKKRRS